MKGLVNSVGRFALFGGTAVALALSASAPASAASMVDRGLGKRVSDLEAEVRLLKNRVKALEARKGGADNVVVSSTSRVKVTLYGQVSRITKAHISSNHTAILHTGLGGSSTRFGLLARGRIDADWTIAGLIETEWTENRSDATNDNTDSLLARVRSRHLVVRLTHANLGTVHLGHTSIAADGSDCYDLTGTSIIVASCGDASTVGGTFLATTGTAHGTSGFQIGAVPGLAFGAYGGVRENLIRYDTPRIAGFRIKVSHSEFDKISAGVDYVGGLGKDIRIIAAFGFDRIGGVGVSSPANATAAAAATSVTTLAGSASIMHVPTGLVLAGGYARFQVQNGLDGSHWWVKGGWVGSIWSTGKTRIAVVYNRGDQRLAIQGWASSIGAGVVQEIDAAFSDLVLGVAYSDGAFAGVAGQGVVSIAVGARIKF